jgi:asparagine synthetase B (glutamine-hydrolysing)
VALVHNGIIENHEELRAELQARGYVFASQTDTEVIAHLVDSLYDGDLFDAVQGGGAATAWRLRHRRVCTRTSRTAWWARAPARR